MKTAPPFGIDLGTTRTAASIFLPDCAAPLVATDEKHRRTLPSIVQPAGEGRWRVGYQALDNAKSGGPPYIESVKRFMGSTDPVRYGGNLLPEEISAILLSSIADRMRRELEGRYKELDLGVRDAVITVPAYFDAPQIEATRRAGELAGLNVAGLVQEPTAAAIYHTWNQGIGDGTFLVYDLGGGTFDVSIIRTLFGEYQVLAIDGDNHLGGDDFDRRLADHFRDTLVERGVDLADKIDSEDDRISFEILRRIARKTKEKLSDEESVQIDEQALFLDRSGRSVDLELTVDRETFEDCIDDLVEATILSSRRALKSAQARHDITAEDVDGIFLVGGSTKVPAVRARIRRTIADELDLGDEQLSSDDPETSVARGAALHAAAVCPLRFVDEEEQITIAVTDLPADNPDRRLIGDVDPGEDSNATHITFGVDEKSDASRRVKLESGELPHRFSIEDFHCDKLPPADTPFVSTTLNDGDEPVYGPVDLWLPERPEDANPLPTLALTNPAVLAKDINVEVVEDGKPTRHTLIERGTHLPTTATHQLVTGDRSGSVVLRLFQHRLPIHTLVLPVPESTPPGTPVELSIDVDQTMTVTASGRVEEQTFWARIDRPSAPRQRQWEEIEELIDRSDEVTERLWGGEARRFEEVRNSLLVGIRAAVRHDPHRLQVLARRLETLLEDYAPRPRRTPGKNRIDTLLDTIRRLVFAADSDRLGRNRQEWKTHLDELRADVDSAWEGDDDSQWHDVADRVQAIYESVAQDEFLFRRRDPKRYAQTLYTTTSSRLQSLSEQTAQFPYAADPDARKLQQGETEQIDEAIAQARTRLPDPPPTPDDVPSMERLARMVTHLERRLERVHVLGVPRKGDSP